MKSIFTAIILFSLVIISSIAHAQQGAGVFTIASGNCSSILSPVINNTWCLIPGPPPNLLLWNGSSYISTSIPNVNINSIQTTINGTFGNVSCSESITGSALKIVNCLLTNYVETGTPQTVCFNGATCTVNLNGVNFSQAPNLLGYCGTYYPTVTLNELVLPANASMLAESCNITAIGQ